MARRPAPLTCANCGADIPRNSRACPECGADERTGWNEQSIYDGLDLPEEIFAESGDEIRKQARTQRRRASGIFWWIVAVILLLAFAGLVLSSRW